ncbi:MAG: AsnC family transcriptional regulator, partial [Candidatus Hodarchaeota archaeon]
MSIDSVDKSLLVELTKNCRASFSTLALQFNIPAEEVSARISQLVKDRIILKFTIAPSLSLFNSKDAILFFRSSNSILDLDRVTLLGVN